MFCSLITMKDKGAERENTEGQRYETANIQIQGNSLFRLTSGPRSYLSHLQLLDFAYTSLGPDRNFLRNESGPGFNLTLIRTGATGEPDLDLTRPWSRVDL